ncbi:hypothetical protein BC834DRAFT_331317 [Gloeopeniophorella convolvens]|nr:hypothetical protein BC834DRAFT_331317 [Gloeopeniophorella convolvens]
MSKRPASRSPPLVPSFPLSQDSASFPSIAAAELEDPFIVGLGSSTQLTSMRPQTKKQKVESADDSDPASHGPPLQSDGTFAPKDILDHLTTKTIKKFDRRLALAVEDADTYAELEKELLSVHAAVVTAIETIPKLSQNAVEEKDFQHRLSDPGKQQEFFRLLKELERKEDFRELIVNDLFLKKPLNKFKPDRKVVIVDESPEQDQYDATTRSWATDFVDSEMATKALEDHIRRIPNQAAARYGPFCPIIQSSGMGKSRLLDEFAKNHFSIPINLRGPDSEGFPPPDANVREYLTYIDKDDPEYPKVSGVRMYAFLLALLSHATAVVKLLGGRDRMERIALFREYMAEGHKMKSVGGRRKLFYDEVLKEAAKFQKEAPLAGKGSPSKQEVPGDKTHLFEAALALRQALYSPIIIKKNAKLPAIPDIIITFDEAHELTKKFGAGSSLSNFTQLRRALRMLDEGSAYAFFLSTDSKISEFAPTQHRDNSNRVLKGTLVLDKPFSALGFDQLMTSRKIGAAFKTIEDITSMECIAHMGRPLWGSRYDHGSEEVKDQLLRFAQNKLICGGVLRSKDDLTESQMFALVSQRLPLDINSARYMTYWPAEIEEKAHKQVENHMRICLEVSQGHEYMLSFSASEPLLSEAASVLMRADDLGFDLPLVLQTVLSGYCISQGDRGELVVAAFFTWARDKVAAAKHGSAPSRGGCSPIFSVRELLSELFVSSMDHHCPPVARQEDVTKTYKDMFGSDGQTFMHFNHFIKALEINVVRQQYLLYYLSRGAGAFGARCQPGVDLVIPYLYKSGELETKNLGYILVQVKLYSTKVSPSAALFRNMDPFHLKLFDSKDPDAGAVPIIRIVFSLGGDEANFQQMSYDSAADAAYDHYFVNGHPRFTSFDYWCSGISGETLGPAAESSAQWVALARTACDRAIFSKTASAESMQRKTYPCGSTVLTHWREWVHNPPPPPEPEEQDSNSGAKRENGGGKRGTGNGKKGDGNGKKGTGNGKKGNPGASKGKQRAT